MPVTAFFRYLLYKGVCFTDGGDPFAVPSHCGEGRQYLGVWDRRKGERADSPCFGGGNSFLEGDSVMFLTLTAEKGSREGEKRELEKIFEKFFVKIFKKY